MVKKTHSYSTQLKSHKKHARGIKGELNPRIDLTGIINHISFSVGNGLESI